MYKSKGLFGLMIPEAYDHHPVRDAWQHGGMEAEVTI